MDGFLPVFDNFSKCLILGSFPSVISRKNEFYYGNKQNRFWKIMQEYFDENFDSVQDKKAFLLKHNIALWDIVKSCEIQGSADSNLKNIQFVELEKILPPFTSISKIFCNGKASYELTLKYISYKAIKIEIVYLPSTSPANVSFDKLKWFAELDKIYKN